MATTTFNFTVCIEDMHVSDRARWKRRMARGRQPIAAGMRQMNELLDWISRNPQHAADMRIGNRSGAVIPSGTVTEVRPTQHTSIDASGHLQRIESMLQRLLLPQELRHLPNADDAHAVLALDAPAASLNEAE